MIRFVKSEMYFSFNQQYIMIILIELLPSNLVPPHQCFTGHLISQNKSVYLIAQSFWRKWQHLIKAGNQPEKKQNEATHKIYSSE